MPVSKLNVAVIPGETVGAGVPTGVADANGVGVGVTGEMEGVGVAKLVLEGFGVAEPVMDGVGSTELLGVAVGLLDEVGVADEEGNADLAGVWVGDGEADGDAEGVGVVAKVPNAYQAAPIITIIATIMRRIFGKVILLMIISSILINQILCSQFTLTL